jgi:hypothetical protein
MKLLFIRGYNTDLKSKLTENSYINFDNFFMLSDIEYEYFNYGLDENLDDVYHKLCEKIHKIDYNILCSHSMGGGLLMKYCIEHPNLKKYTKVIFMMPLICKVNYVNILSKIVPEWLKLPKALVIPNNNLFEDGNILNDTYNLISVKQIIQMYNYIDKFNLNILNKENCVLIYAKEEKLNIISKDVLDTIKNKYFVNGRHACFSESNNSNEFFQLFKTLIIPKKD